MTAAPTASAGTTPPSSWVWGFGRLAVHAYYRVERIGEELPTGALLLVANHPNTLIDPAVIQTSAGRRVRFLAKSTLFAWHPLSPLIRRSGAIPVYRKMDPGVDTSRNVEMFAAVAASLASGEAICLFPEGTSHARGKLEPLRTGAARMVLNSCAAGHPVTIVPVGLNFDALARFRSRVTTVFGRPLEYGDLAARYAGDEMAAVRELTDRIEQRLKHLMVEAEPRHDLPIVERIDRLYAAARGASRDARERLGRRRLIAAGMAKLRERDPARLAEIMTQVEDHLAGLARFGLRERDLEQRIPAADVVRFALREGLLALLLGPVALASVVLFAVPYRLTDWIGRRGAQPAEPRRVADHRRRAAARDLDCGARVHRRVSNRHRRRGRDRSRTRGAGRPRHAGGRTRSGRLAHHARLLRAAPDAAPGSQRPAAAAQGPRRRARRRARVGGEQDPLLIRARAGSPCR